MDTTGVLADIQLEDEFNSKNSPWKKNFEKKNSKPKETKTEEIERVIENLSDGIEPITLDDLVEYFAGSEKPISEKTVRRRIEKSDRYMVKNKKILPQTEVENSENTPENS